MSEKDARERIAKFLERIVAMNEKVCAVFAPPSLKQTLFKEVEKAFGGRKSQTMDLSVRDRDAVDKAISTSMKEGSLLLVHIGKDSPPLTLRRIEQILDEGHISIGLPGNWIKVEPVEGWQAVVWVDSTQIGVDQFLLKDILTSKLVVTA